MRAKQIGLCLLLLIFSGIWVSAQLIYVGQIAGQLNNPRGVAVLADGRLLVVEAGLGNDIPGEAVGSGQISIFEDANGDGDYDDAGERTPIIDEIPSYNSLPSFRSGHDEVFGLSDVVVLPDGQIFFTKDDPFFEPGHAGEEGFYGDVGIFQYDDAARGDFTRLIKRIATLNSLTFDAENNLLYVVESGFNRLAAVDMAGEVEVVAEFPILASGQQAVPSGVVLDTQSDDVLVALLSGFIYGYTDAPLSYVPGDAKIVRVNPATGTVTDEITGLTLAIDLTIDPAGNLYVVQLSTQWPSALMPYDFDLYTDDTRPDPGGYARYTGRVTMYPAGSRDEIILADGIDTPTNITYAAGRLYVSSGLGTPGRAIWTPDGIATIEGKIFVISGF